MRTRRARVDRGVEHRARHVRRPWSVMGRAGRLVTCVQRTHALRRRLTCVHCPCLCTQSKHRLELFMKTSNCESTIIYQAVACAEKGRSAHRSERQDASCPLGLSARSDATCMRHDTRAPMQPQMPAAHGCIRAWALGLRLAELRLKHVAWLACDGERHCGG